jgi:hypothetical protein
MEVRTTVLQKPLEGSRQLRVVRIETAKPADGGVQLFVEHKLYLETENAEPEEVWQFSLNAPITGLARYAEPEFIDVRVIDDVALVVWNQLDYCWAEVNRRSRDGWKAASSREVYDYVLGEGSLGERASGVTVEKLDANRVILQVQHEKAQRSEHQLLLDDGPGAWMKKPNN